MLDHIVFVEWEDSFGCPAGWEFEDELQTKVTKVQSVGRVIREDDNSITIAPHVSTAERRQLAGHITIPRRQITVIRELCGLRAIDVAPVFPDHKSYGGVY